MSNKTFSRMLRRWMSRGGRPGAKSRRPAAARLRVEEIEPRVVPATFTTPLPAPTVTETQPIQLGFQPQVAIDPTNPQRLVVVSATGANTAANPGLRGSFSLDGGSSWNAFDVITTDLMNTVVTAGNPPPVGPLNDPTTPSTNYAFFSSPSVAWARDGTIYLTFLAHNATYSSGAIFAKVFTFDPALGPIAQTRTDPEFNAAFSPIIPFVPGVNQNTGHPTATTDLSIIYRWVDPTGGTRDQAFNPSVAVDNNVPRFVDPVTGEVSTDTLVGTSTTTESQTNTPGGTANPAPFYGKAAYITWNTNTIRPSLLTDTVLIGSTPHNPNAIFVSATGDRGQNWTTPVPVNDSLGLTFSPRVFGSQMRAGGFYANSSDTSPVPRLSPVTAPRIVFSPPEVNPNATVTPGSMKFYWSTVDPNNNNPAFQFIRQDTSQPDSGAAAQSVASAATFLGNGGLISEPQIPASGSGPDIPFIDIVPGTPSPYAATVALPADFGTVTDLNVRISVYHPHVNQLSITLVPPAGSGLPSVVLLLNRTLGDGTDRLPIPSTGIRPGIPDTQNLGILPNGEVVGTTFDQEASRIISDPVSEAAQPYTTSLRPEVFSGAASLADLYGKAALTYNGVWRLEIRDFRDDDRLPGFTPNIPPPRLEDWALRFSGVIDNDVDNNGTRFGADASLSSPVAGAVPGTNEIVSGIAPIRGGPGPVQPTLTIGSPNVGVNPGVSMAYDTSLGSASIYSGRLYAVYTGGAGNNTNIFLVYSNNNGLPNPDGSTSWSDPIQVNDDSRFDQVTEGTRAQFQPSVTVDPVTGTVVVMWYDARLDASNARYATFLATSTDGGQTFTINQGTAGSPQTFLNLPKQAVDAITRNVVTLEPTPDNIAASENSPASPFGFGIRQSLVAYDGRINTFWTGNLNASATLAAGVPRQTFTATVRIANGPRLVDNPTGETATGVILGQDMGTIDSTATILDGAGGVARFLDRTTLLPIDPLAVPRKPAAVDRTDSLKKTFAVYNDRFAPDGTRLLDGFKVVFDRPIDIRTFTAADIVATFRDPKTPLSLPPTVIPTLDPVPVLISRDTQDNNRALIPGDPFAVAGQLLASTFFVPFTTPQSKVGTYSYQVGPNIRNIIWQTSAGGNPVSNPTKNVTPISVQADVGPVPALVLPGASPNLPAAYARFAAPFAAADIPAGGKAIPNPPPNGPGGQTTSIITVPALPPPDPSQANPVVFDLVVKVDIDHSRVGDLNIQLVSPSGRVVTLLSANPGNTGKNLSGTTFDDRATRSIDNITTQGSPYTGRYRPSATLSDNGIISTLRGTIIGGDWQLVITDVNSAASAAGDIGFGKLNAWSLTIVPGHANEVDDPATPANEQTAWLGGYLDQNADGRSLEYVGAFTGGNDVYSVPTPSTSDATPFTAPYNNTTQPLSTPGPHVIETYVPGQTPTLQTVIFNTPVGGAATIAQTGTTRALALTFDRAVDPLTFDLSKVARVADPQGRTITPAAGTNFFLVPTYPAGIDGFGNTKPTKTFLLGLPDPAPAPYSPGNYPAGRYTVTLTPGIKAADGLFGNTSTLDLLSVDLANPARPDPAAPSKPTRGVNLSFDRQVISNTIDPSRLTVTDPNGATVAGPFVLYRLNPDGTANLVPAGSKDITPSGRFQIVFPGDASLYPASGQYTVALGGTEEAADTGATDLVVRFDRAIRPNTFTTADVLSFVGPTGTLAPISVTPLVRSYQKNPLNTGVDGYTEFDIKFAPQAVSGPYSIQFSSDIRSVRADGDPLGDRVDTNLNAGLDILRGGDPKTEAVVRDRYDPTDPITGQPATTQLSQPKPIDPFGTQRITIDVPEAFVIQQTPTQSIQVRLNVEMFGINGGPAIRDLTGTLIAPDGTRIRLFTQPGQASSGADERFVNTYFDDFSSNPIQSPAALPPFNSGSDPQGNPLPNTQLITFNPQLPLSELVGRGMKGTWTLEITNLGASAGNFLGWSLFLPHTVVDPSTGLGQSGLGQQVADQFQAGFRVFIEDPTNSVTTKVWTPLTGAVNGSDNAGRVPAVAIDPADPSGNTVYIGASSGGVWKTTNFLTTDPAGPTWIPLTDFGPTTGANVASIALFNVIDPVTKIADPAKTQVFAVTGDPNTIDPAKTTYGANGVITNLSYGKPGVGLLRSLDAGKTWRVLDSTSNVDPADPTQAILPINSPLRDHRFAGATGYRIVADPTPSTTGVVLYMAVSGTVNANPSLTQGGVWRSLDGGLTWTVLKAGNATDISLISGVVDSNGNRRLLYGAFRGDGVYLSTQAPAGATMTLVPDPSTNPGLNTVIRDVTNQFRGDVATTVGNANVNPNSAPNPNATGTKGRITLASVPATGNPLLDSFYSGWLYAFVANPPTTTPGQPPSATMNGLYMTKDFGQRWVQADLAALQGIFDAPYFGAFGTNDESKANIDLFDPVILPGNRVAQGEEDIAISVDPSNPNIVILGGAGGSNGLGLPLAGLIRVDMTKIKDSQALVSHNYSDPGFGTNATSANGISTNTIGAATSQFGNLRPRDGNNIQGAGQGNPYRNALVIPNTPILFPNINSNNPRVPFQPIDIPEYQVYAADFLNLSRDPNNPFVSNSSLQVINDGSSRANADIDQQQREGPTPGRLVNLLESTIDGYSTPDNGLTGFKNDGSDVTIRPLGDPFDPLGDPIGAGSINQGGPLSTASGATNNVQTIIPFTDPITKKTRYILGTGSGIYTGVDRGDGKLSLGIGFSSLGSANAFVGSNGTRNGNLAVEQFYSGAAQPSQLAADIAGAFYYGMSRDNGFPVSTATIIQTGIQDAATKIGDNQTRQVIDPTGTGVVIDPTGTGTAYQYRNPLEQGPSGLPAGTNGTFVSTDFVRALLPNTNPALGGISRTGVSGQGLVLPGVDVPLNSVGQWPGQDNGANDTGYLAINPTNGAGLLIGGAGTSPGRVFRSTNGGATWSIIGDPYNNATPSLETSVFRALAFGARKTGANQNELNNFVIAGDLAGNIFVTRSGGANWTRISAGLDGSAVMQIVADPRIDSTDAVAVTQKGVFYNLDVLSPTSRWQNITGNLFSLNQTAFGESYDPTSPVPTLTRLNTIAVDWRYRIPVAGQTLPRPDIYAGGDGGVYKLRNLDATFSGTWSYFPDVNTPAQTREGAAVVGGYLPHVEVTRLDLSLGNLVTDPTSPRFGLPQEDTGLNMLVASTFGRGGYAIRLATAADKATVQRGPRVVNVLNPNAAAPSDRLQVLFSGAVDPATFTTNDVQIKDNTGKLVPVVAVNLISTAPPGGSNPRNLYEVVFAPQSTPALYTITIGATADPATQGPRISDLAGNLMNQDDDDVNGEPIVDSFTTTVFLNGINTNLNVVNLPATAVAGQPVTFTVTVTNGLGQIQRDFTGQVVFSSSDLRAVLPASYTFTSDGGLPGTTADNGQRTFTVTFATGGPQFIQVQTVNPNLANSAKGNTTVLAGQVDRFVVTGSPATVVAGNVVTYTVKAQDKFGNDSITFAGTETITSTDPQATQNGNTLPDTFTMANGRGTFDLVLRTAGTQTVTVTDTTTTTLTGSGTTTVVSDVAKRFVVAAPSPVTAGTPFTATVTALDQFNNTATGYTGTVQLTSSDAAAVLPPDTPLSAGAGSFQVTLNTPGSQSLRATDAANPGLTGVRTGITVNSTGSVSPPPPPATNNLTGTFAVGSNAGGSPDVVVFGPGGSPQFQFTPFPAGFAGQVDPFSGGFTGGNRVAVGDVTGDGVADYVVGTGPTISTFVKVIDGRTRQEVLTYQPFEAAFTGGVFVAVGDVNGDKIQDIIITPDEGGGPRVLVLQGGTFTLMANFFGIDDPNFRGGARAAAGDINGDGFADVAVAAGFGGGPRVAVFDGKSLVSNQQVKLFNDFFIFDGPDALTLRNGAFVALGDIDGDGKADVIGGGGPGGGPRVFALSGDDLLRLPAPRARVLANFFAGDVSNRGGVQVAAKNLDGDAFADLVVGAGPGGGTRVTAYKGSTLPTDSPQALYGFDAFGGLNSGVYVG